MKLSGSILTAAVINAAVVASVSAQVSNFDTLNGYAGGVEAQVSLARNRLVQFDSSLHNATGVVLSAGYADRSTDKAPDGFDRDSKSTLGLVGYNWKASQWNFGAGVGASDVSGDYTEVNSPSPTPIHGSVDSSTVEGVVWAGVDIGALRVSASAAFGNTKNDGTRLSDAGSSKASYDSQARSFSLRASYALSVSESISLQPFIGFSNATSDTDGFTEQGTAPDRRILQDFKVKESNGVVGVRIAGKSRDWVPSATIAWVDRLSGGETTIRNSAINGSNLGAGISKSGSDGHLFLGAGIDAALSDRFTGKAEVGYFNGNGQKELSFRLAGLIRF